MACRSAQENRLHRQRATSTAVVVDRKSVRRKDEGLFRRRPVYGPATGNCQPTSGARCASTTIYPRSKTAGRTNSHHPRESAKRCVTDELRGSEGASSEVDEGEVKTRDAV